MNKLISIGYVGIKKCYLNIDNDTAVERYCKSENISSDDFINDEYLSINTIEFVDEFGAYDVYE